MWFPAANLSNISTIPGAIPAIRKAKKMSGQDDLINGVLLEAADEGKSPLQSKTMWLSAIVPIVQWGLPLLGVVAPPAEVTLALAVAGYTALRMVTVKPIKKGKRSRVIKKAS